MTGTTPRAVSDEEAVTAMRPAALAYAKRFSRHDHSLMPDLIQEGLMGAMEAARTFDPARGHKFATYAEFRVWGRMRDYVRDHEDALTRVQRRQAKETGEVPFRVVSLDLLMTAGNSDREDRKGFYRIDPTHHDPEPSDGLEAEFVAWVRRRFPGRLYPDQVRILADYYARDLSIWEIADRLGVSDSRASQVMAATLTALLGGVRPKGMRCGHKHSGRRRKAVRS